MSKRRSVLQGIIPLRKKIPNLLDKLSVVGEKNQSVKKVKDPYKITLTESLQ